MPEKKITVILKYFSYHAKQILDPYSILTLTVKYNLQYDHLDEKNEELFYPVRYLSPPSRENLRNGELRHEMRLVISTPIISACQIARLLPPADVQRKKQTPRKRPLALLTNPPMAVCSTRLYSLQPIRISMSPTRSLLRAPSPSPEQLPQLPSVLLSVSERLFQLRHLRHPLLLRHLFGLRRLFIRLTRPRPCAPAHYLALLDRLLQPVLHEEREPRPRRDLH